jgi:hypothetical protein
MMDVLDYYSLFRSTGIHLFSLLAAALPSGLL